ncbi:YraN family protein [Frondihabitans australicus]|uniref:UPF0102 protein C8E83_0779 n=1 Tax=Frondihabitans australicus TaxID=386892 RepID=A0A495IEU7_9MICO|nr:YraN family protein [Frondihabitans australicus]RKR73685.1 putative endonuclease [Frondihabitans australicus]
MTKSTRSRELGIRGEQEAAEHLERSGFRILARNWRCAEGEIDIVAHEAATGDVVIVEVKTRRGHGAGHPFEAVSREKLSRLRTLATAWSLAHPGVGCRRRIDVVGVTAWPDDSLTVQHLVAVDL